MMSRARARGLDVTIYRPAFVGWHSVAHGSRGTLSRPAAARWGLPRALHRGKVPRRRVLSRVAGDDPRRSSSISDDLRRFPPWRRREGRAATADARGTTLAPLIETNHGDHHAMSTCPVV